MSVRHPSLPNPQNKYEPDWALYYVRKWIFFSLRFSHEEQTERGTKRWRLPSLTLWSGRSITQYRSRMKAYLQRGVHRHPACSRPPNRPLRFNGDDEPAINLLSFRALFHKPVLFSPSALLSINHSLFKSLVQRSVKRDSQIYKESRDVFLRRLAYLLGLHIVYGTFLRQHNASLSEV